MTTTASKRVLIVDDDAVIRELLCAILRQRDLVVDEAADGQEALELLKENIYSVVLLDLLMPNVDGFGVLEGLTSSPVVLVITGRAVLAHNVGLPLAGATARNGTSDLGCLGPGHL